MKPKYEGVLEELSQTDPVLAFKISNLPMIDKALDHLYSYIENSNEDLITTPNSNEELGYLVPLTNAAKDLFNQKSIDDLEKVIKGISWSVGLLCCYKISKICKKKKNIDFKVDEEEINKQFKNWLKSPHLKPLIKMTDSEIDESFARQS